jgi:HNH endonuclease
MQGTRLAAIPAAALMLSPRAWARFDSKFIHSNGCWLWTAGKDPDGYGVFWLNGRTVRAHRVAYTNTVGPIPEGLTLDHSCRVRHCVNPAHLSPATFEENSSRQVGWQLAKTHCPQGHEYTDDNTYRYGKRPMRLCRTCDRDRHR